MRNESGALGYLAKDWQARMVLKPICDTLQRHASAQSDR